MQLVRMNIVATRDLDDRTLSHQAFLNDPQLLSRCPPPAPLRAGKYRHSHRVCPLICKSMGKPVTSTANPIGGLHRMRTLEIARFQGLRRWKLAILFSGFPRIEKRDSVAVSEGAMRPKKHETTGSGDLFRAQLDQIINMRHELVQLAGKVGWGLIGG